MKPQRVTTLRVTAILGVKSTIREQKSPEPEVHLYCEVTPTKLRAEQYWPAIFFSILFQLTCFRDRQPGAIFSNPFLSDTIQK